MGCWPQNMWEMGGWHPEKVVDGRLAPKTGGRLEVAPKNKGEMLGWLPKQVGDQMLAQKQVGGWPLKQVGDGRFRLPATPPL